MQYRSKCGVEANVVSKQITGSYIASSVNTTLANDGNSAVGDGALVSDGDKAAGDDVLLQQV